jgi:biopolymer transport protein ExbD
MSYNPSKRTAHELDEVFINLNPMMDMFAVLIPALLMLSAVVEISIVDISAPSIGPPSGAPDTPPEKPPLNLSVTITDRGYTISTRDGVMAGPQSASGEPGGPTLPLIEKRVHCSRYRGTVPPPRSRNKDRTPCEPKKPANIDLPEWKKMYMMYNNSELTRKAVELKDKNPDEVRIIIAPEPQIDYETIIEVLDAMRDIKEGNAEIRTLFDEVVVQPAVVQ